MSEPMLRSTQTVHLSCVKISIISKQIKISFHLSLVNAPKLTLSPKRKKWNSKWPTSPRSSIGCVQNDVWAYVTFDANRSPILCEDTHYIQTNRNELSLQPHHRGVPSGASKTIFEPLVRLAQTVHLSCTDTNTVSKRKVRFHMTRVTKEFHRVCPKWCPSLWYVRCKPCNYLASRLALSPNGPKRAFTCASSPWSTISWVQNDF
jgi:hypothetical protein